MSKDDKKTSKPKTVKETQANYLIDERFEIIGGVRYDFLASPKLPHQLLLGGLYAAFRLSCAQSGTIVMAPMDVHLDEDNMLQPDLIFVSSENAAILRDGFIYGAPDLVVEILSDSTARRDKTIKKMTYERFGVREFWIADAENRYIEQFVLLDGTYRQVAILGPEDRLVSATLPCLNVELSTIFKD